MRQLRRVLAPCLSGRVVGPPRSHAPRPPTRRRAWRGAQDAAEAAARPAAGEAPGGGEAGARRASVEAASAEAAREAAAADAAARAARKGDPAAAALAELERLKARRGPGALGLRLARQQGAGNSRTTRAADGAAGRPRPALAFQGTMRRRRGSNEECAPGATGRLVATLPYPSQTLRRAGGK